MVNSELPERLKAARIAAGLNQVDLAEKIGLSHAQVSRIERGLRDTSPDTVQKWLEVCGYTMEIVSLGADSRAAAIADALAAADQEGVEVAVRLLRLWPRLSARERRLLSAEMDVYEDEYLRREP